MSISSIPSAAMSALMGSGNINKSSFVAAEFSSSGSGGGSFAAIFVEDGKQVGGAMGITNPMGGGHCHGSGAAQGTGSGSGSGSGSASLGSSGLDLSSLFNALFNMLESGSGSTSTGSGSGSGTIDALLEMSSTDGSSGTTASDTSGTGSGNGSSGTISTAAASGASSGNGSGTSTDAASSSWVAQIFSDMQNLFENMETAATQTSQLQISA